ncbi:MAG: hypothetical protein U5L96_18550 [Owenweeksia sp.]|nr:hypothetical protein [Owenweeksia sp.]
MNLVGTGREWLGHLFDFELQYSSKTFKFPNRDQSSPVQVRVRSLARASSGNTFMRASVNGTPFLQMGFNQYATGEYAPYATITDSTKNVSVNGDNILVELEYDNSSNPAAIAWQDFIQVQTRRNLNFAGAPLLFRDAQSIGPGEVVQFNIGNAATDLEVWDVTYHNEIQAMPLNFDNGTASFTDTADQLKQYAAFAGSNMPQPNFIGALAQQNLRGLPTAEMLIVTHPIF